MHHEYESSEGKLIAVGSLISGAQMTLQQLTTDRAENCYQQIRSIVGAKARIGRRIEVRESGTAPLECNLDFN